MSFGNMIIVEMMDYLRQYPVTLVALFEVFFHIEFYNRFLQLEFKTAFGLLRQEIISFAASLPEGDPLRSQYLVRQAIFYD